MAEVIGTPRDVTIPAQIRAGRALLDWSQVQLAEAAGIGVSTVKAFESGRPGKKLAAAGPMRVALEREGVVFLSGNEEDGPGVRLYRPVLPPPLDPAWAWCGAPPRGQHDT